jgi:hypothetical protein
MILLVAATITRILHTIAAIKLEFRLKLHAIQRGAKKYHFPFKIACKIKQIPGYIAAIQNERLR